LRIKEGLSQERLAEEIGVSKQLISKWEQGDEIPDLHHLMALSDWFGISLDELLRKRINYRTLQQLNLLEEYPDTNDLVENITLIIFMILMIILMILDYIIIGLGCGAIGVGLYFLIRLKKR
ncbi:MAG: helix-turn-helix transcriptional regulator, partial [Turicibacter sp.]|nr:helix-turn-helix transcriptional regulator [Turicibacter sp.]